MVPLSAAERAQLSMGLAQLQKGDTTFLFLSDCVAGALSAHQAVLPDSCKASLDSYVQAVSVLQKHREYLAFRLGLQWGTPQP